MKKILEKQQEFFKSGKTLDIKYRLDFLKKLRQMIKENEASIAKALKEDLGKSATEAYMCEVGLTLSEITYMLKHMRKFTKEKRVKTPMAQFCSKSFTFL